MYNIEKIKPFCIICGHYGCGKTNLSIHLALEYARRGEQVTIVDLDIVNPYFRTSDYREELERAGVRLICPSYAATNLDLPSLPAEMYSIFTLPGRIILDVGGDDVGATVLGRFHEKMMDMDYDMLYVMNFYRGLTTEPSEMAELLREIEMVSRLKGTGLINNSHLKQETTMELIEKAEMLAEEASRKIQLPLLFTTVPEMVYDKRIDNDGLLPVGIHVKTVWE